MEHLATFSWFMVNVGKYIIHGSFGIRISTFGRREVSTVPSGKNIFSDRWSCHRLILFVVVRLGEYVDRFKVGPYDHYKWSYTGVSKNRGTPKWMVYNGKPYKHGMIWGFYPYFWKHPYIPQVITPYKQGYYFPQGNLLRKAIYMG